MAKIKVTGIDSFNTKLTELYNKASEINSKGLYDGAGYFADEFNSELRGCPRRTDKYDGEHRMYGFTSEELSQVTANFGISKHRKSNGNIETKIGFTGYVDVPYYSQKFGGKRMPTGYLVQMVEYGSHSRKPIHKLSSAINRLGKLVPKKIEETITTETNKIIK